jgi:hypothetical protein
LHPFLANNEQDGKMRKGKNVVNYFAEKKIRYIFVPQ